MNSTSTNNVSNEIILSHYSQDEIIRYEEENGIVKGYLNQRALDFCLFERARQRTNNFSLKSEWDAKRVKRNLTLNDISSFEHSIFHRPVDDDEFVSKGSVILSLGLKSGFSSYCVENNISDFETWLDCAIKVYSAYSGYFTIHKADHKTCLQNTDNTIKDGDLLFIIKIAERPKEVISSVNEFVFNYGLLSRDFLNGLSDFSMQIKEWLVENYSLVNKGDKILVLTKYFFNEPKSSFTIESPYTGILVRKFDNESFRKCDVIKGEILFSVYSDFEALKKNYPNKIVIESDEFSKNISVIGKMYAGDDSGFRIVPRYSSLNTFLNFKFSSGKYFLILNYDRKLFILNKKCTFQLLMSDGSVIVLNALTNPVHGSYNSTIYYPFSVKDLQKLVSAYFVKWQIINDDGFKIRGGINMCCGDSNNCKKRLSCEVFQDFVKDFKKKVEDNCVIEEYNADEENLVDNKNTPCFVYLMVDITNDYCKIGISNHPKYREHTLQSEKPTIELIVAKEYPTRKIAEAIESALHKVFGNKRIRGEWFNLSESEIESIKKTLK